MSRDFGKVATGIWRSKKFKTLGDNADAKLLYIYLLSNSNGNSIGVYELPIGYIMADLGWQDSRINSAMIALCEALLIGWNEVEEVVSIANFLQKSPITNKKHAIGAFKTALSLPECPEKYKVIKEIGEDKYARQLDEVKAYLDGLDSPIHSPMHTIETETQTETQTETERETPPPIIPPADGCSQDEDKKWVLEDGLQWIWLHGGKQDEIREFLSGWLSVLHPSIVREIIEQAQISAKANPRNWIATVLTRKASDAKDNPSVAPTSQGKGLLGHLADYETNRVERMGK